MKQLSQINTIRFTALNGGSEKVSLETPIEWIDNAPPKFLIHRGRLWKYKGIGGGTWMYFYHEEKSVSTVGYFS